MLQNYDPPIIPVKKPKTSRGARGSKSSKAPSSGPRVAKSRATGGNVVSNAATVNRQPEPMDTSEAYAAFIPLEDDDVPAPDPFDGWGGFDEVNAAVEDDDAVSVSSDGFTDTSLATTAISESDAEDCFDSPTPSRLAKMSVPRFKGGSRKGNATKVMSDGPRVVLDYDGDIF